VYTHIIMGPEIAAGWFRPIATSPSFKKRVCLVAVDELHLVSLWGSGIRPQYAQLSLLRRRLGAVPWFGCSATLDPVTLKIARRMTGFSENCEFFRTSVDRPEIKLIVETIEPRTIRKFTSLVFVIQDAMAEELPVPGMIPKTVIFIDSRSDIQRCADFLRVWLVKLSSGQISDRKAREIIQVYHSHTSLKDKEVIYNEFSKTESKIRIMVATESLGTGVDLSDIKRVVQYGFPLDPLISVLVQRFGRAARLNGMTGEAIFLVESWAVGDRIIPSRRAVIASSQSTVLHFRQTASFSRLSQSTSAEKLSGDEDVDAGSDVAGGDIGESGEQEKRKRKSEKERRTDLYNDSPALFNFVNRSACLRNILMDWMQEILADPSTKLPAPPPADCCNVCNPSLARMIPFPWDITSNIRKPQSGTASGAFYDRLVLWCDETLRKQHPRMISRVSLLLADKNELIQLSKDYQVIKSETDLENRLESHWLKANVKDLVPEFFKIKTYVTANWPGGSRVGTATVAPVSKSQWRITQEERNSEESQDTTSTEYQTPQQRRDSFQRDRDDYAAKLRDTIRRAKESATMYTPYPPPQAGPVPAESCTMSIFTTGTAASCAATSDFEDSENELPLVENTVRQTKRSALIHPTATEAKRVALGELDSNARNPCSSPRSSPRRNKGMNTWLNNRTWIL
jgi:hypothetical protein